MKIMIEPIIPLRIEPLKIKIVIIMYFNSTIRLSKGTSR